MLACLLWLLLATCNLPAQAGTSIDYLSKQQVQVKALGCYGLPVTLKMGAMRLNGTYVTYVFREGRAQNNNLHAGDIVLKVNNLQTATPEILNTVLVSLKNQPVEVDIATGGSRVEIKRISLLQSSKQSNPHAKRSVADLETLMYQLIDEDRSKKGLSRLRHSSSLARMARAYADDMAKRGFTGHKDPEGRGPIERAKLLGIRPESVIAENCHYPYAQANALDMVRDAEKTLMDSPSHSVSIINPDYECMGVGIAFRRDGGLMVVQEFSAQKHP